MNCYVAAIAGLSLFGASLSTMSVSREQHDLLKQALSHDLDQRYEAIAHERRNHYAMGLLLGAFLSLLLVRRFRPVSLFTRMTLFLMITLMTAVIFYTVMPKSDYMLHHLKSKEEIEAWFSVYQTMKHRYVLGFLLGGLAALPLSMISC